MKLITRFILIYLLVTAVVLSAGGVISYYIIKKEINFELERRFMDRIDRVTYLIEHSDRFERKVSQPGKTYNEHGMIIRMSKQHVDPHVVVSDTMAWHDGLQRMENNLKVAAYRNVNGNGYYIATFGVLVESDDITEAVVKTLLWILGLQIIGAVGVGMFVSGRLFKPFRTTLKRIRSFKLRQREPIPADETKVREFNELNRFVQEMTRKAISDYQNLKEFAENASHELQTPLAIAKGKLELLMETDLEPEQYQYLESAERAINKLSRLSESLALITKIENQEFDQNEAVNFTHLIRENLQAFGELIELNDIMVETDLAENVMVNMPSFLADTLWTNLLQNAIKHNVPDGKIRIKLTPEQLVISNSGMPLDDINPESLYERFKKGDQNSNSIGLGLSIVKRIVDQNGFDISYTYNDGIHTMKIDFNKS